ncbi:Chaperone protein fimC precursor [Pragia fontium]|uniref:fimbrial biogenesis chaperone n=1 Tax=Pragia fontium TaxID=82985 RepID=UPI000DFFF9BF|nr:molecular chaperone [Pragia fontium]SUB82574.1 Chaperone protein fimC precursor [Pragia fontium]
MHITQRGLMGALFLCLSTLCNFIVRADSGIHLNQTRVIYSGANSIQNVTIGNQGGQLYLLQSSVQLSLDNSNPAPFMVTPPLARLAANSSNVLRILRQGDTPLPEDRESLFYLSVLAIPSLPGDVSIAEQSRLSMGLRFLLKLFYRPQGLSVTPEQTYCQLQLSQNGHRVRITNPGPYFLTFSQLTLGYQVVDLERYPSMIPPMSYQDYPITQAISQAYWQLITDYGGASARCQSSLLTRREAP